MFWVLHTTSFFFFFFKEFIVTTLVNGTLLIAQKCTFTISCLQARSQTCEKRLLVSSVCLSVRRMEQLGSLWTDFHEIGYLGFFLKYLSRKFKFL